MRIVSALAAFTLFIALEAGAQTTLIGERDTARPGGVYTTLNLGDAAACAQLCAEDGICMAWTFRASTESACDLQAIATEPVEESGAISGLSSRAPEFARRLARATAAPVDLTPELQGEETDTANTSVASIDLAENHDLLGAPEASADLGLRLRSESQ